MPSVKKEKMGQPALKEAAVLPRRTRSQSSGLKSETDQPLVAGKQSRSTSGVKKEPTDVGTSKVKEEPVKMSKMEGKNKGKPRLPPGHANMPLTGTLQLPDMRPVEPLWAGGVGSAVGNKRKAEMPADTHGKQKSAKTSKQASSQTRFFTCYWSPAEIDCFAGVSNPGPRGIHVTGGNAKRLSHNKLQAGDVYFPVTLKKGKLMVLGRLRVQNSVEPQHLSEKAYKQWHFSRQLPMIAGCYGPRVLIETDPEEWAGLAGLEFRPLASLRWIKPGGEERELTDPSNMRYVSTALQGVYRLAPKSAELLTKCLKQS